MFVKYKKFMSNCVYQVLVQDLNDRTGELKRFKASRSFLVQQQGRDGKREHEREQLSGGLRCGSCKRVVHVEQVVGICG